MGAPPFGARSLPRSGERALTARAAWTRCRSVHLDAPTPYADAPRVVVVSGDPLARRALAAALRPYVEAARAVASLDDIGDPDVVVWDLGATEAAARDRLAAHAPPDAPVVALLGAPGLARAAFTWGARAVLPRDAADDVLAAALRAVARGLAVAAPSLLAEALAERAEPDAPRATGEVSLTGREREVLGLVAEGFSNKLAARRLGISEHTVKSHLDAVMERLGARTRTEAVVRAARRGLLTL